MGQQKKKFDFLNCRKIQKKKENNLRITKQTGNEKKITSW